VIDAIRGVVGGILLSGNVNVVTTGRIAVVRALAGSISL